MKRSLLFILFATVVAVTATAQQQTTQEIYGQAMRAYSSGDLETAKVLFAQVLAAEPNHVQAATFMKRIEAASTTNANVKKQVESLMVPKVDFQDASLSSVLDYLDQVAKEQSGGKVGLNIVRMFPSDVGAEKKVTLSLSNVPMSSVLEYVAQLAGMQLQYQAHAIVMKPAGA